MRLKSAKVEMEEEDRTQSYRLLVKTPDYSTAGVSCLVSWRESLARKQGGGGTAGTTCDNSNYFYESRGNIMSSEQRQTIITCVHQVDPDTLQPLGALNILVYTECYNKRCQLASQQGSHTT